MSLPLAGLILIAVAWSVCVGCPLYRNWTRAKKLDVPLIISPASYGSLSWLLLRCLLDYNILPTCIARLPFLRLIRRDWVFHEKFAFHAEYGALFILVTSARCELYVADNHAAQQILARRNDFPKPRQLLGMSFPNCHFCTTVKRYSEKMNIFGKNLASVEGADWQRHRKLITRALHENMHEAVWVESSKHASTILKQWGNIESLRATRSDIMTLSLAVLFKACLKIDGNTNNHTGILPEDIAACHWHLTVVLDAISRSVTPTTRNEQQDVMTSLKALGKLLAEFVKTRRASSTYNPQGDLLSSILAPADHRRLADEEITGNLFLFLFAGHETTANALIYIIHLLAIFPSWQDWAIAEVDQILCKSTNCETPQYGTIFPRIKRLRAILFETLRLYGPVPTIVRMTNDHDQTITFPDKSVIIPKNTPVNLNTMALHTNPRKWSPDPLAWRPDRWISSSTSASSEEEICKDMSTYLLAWGDGPRVCPGQKFSQVEIFAVLLCVLKHHRVELVPRPGQTMGQARSYAHRLIQNSKVTLTLQMPMAETVGLRWVLR
ncbi:hypothetical protein BBP40_002009 [Aspergillus hancockii]|nr:hypothetical protein BBP40_002009 [Aspergillus hancockii]